MPDTTTHLLLPYLLAAQAQKHVTLNEALRLLDAMVQLAVLDRTRTAPPGSPDDGDRHIVASGATGLWAGWDLNIAYWVDGAWTRLVPRPGWLAWIAAEAAFVGLERHGLGRRSARPRAVSDADFSLVQRRRSDQEGALQPLGAQRRRDPDLHAAEHLERARDPRRHADLHRRQDLRRAR